MSKLDENVEVVTKEVLENFIQLCYECSVAHGFHDEKPENVGEKVALIHSELSEFLEGYRSGAINPDQHCAGFSNEEIELADAVIRVFDLAGMMKYRLAAAILAKYKYNLTRPYKHGKKF